MINTGEVAALIKALGSGGVSSSDISEAVSDYLDDHPELVTTVQDGSITYAKLDSSLKDSVDDVSDLKNEIKTNVNASDIWESGGIAAGVSGGGNNQSSKSIVENTYFPNNVKIKVVDSNFSFFVGVYSDATNRTWIGFWKNSSLDYYSYDSLTELDASAIAQALSATYPNCVIRISIKNVYGFDVSASSYDAVTIESSNIYTRNETDALLNNYVQIAQGSANSGKALIVDSNGSVTTGVPSDVTAMKTATAEDVGKALSPKTVLDGIVTEWQFITGGSGSALIDDTAGTGDTDKAWSADKLTEEFSPINDVIDQLTEEKDAPVNGTTEFDSTQNYASVASNLFILQVSKNEDYSVTKVKIKVKKSSTVGAEYKFKLFSWYFNASNNVYVRQVSDEITLDTPTEDYEVQTVTLNDPFEVSAGDYIGIIATDDGWMGYIASTEDAVAPMVMRDQEYSTIAKDTRLWAYQPGFTKYPVCFTLFESGTSLKDFVTSENLVPIQEDIEELNADHEELITKIQTALDGDKIIWEKGNINSSGKNETSTTYVRTKGYLHLSAGASIWVGGQYTYGLYTYTDDFEFVSRAVAQTSSNITSTGYYRIVLGATVMDADAITPYNNVIQFSEIQSYEQLANDAINYCNTQNAPFRITDTSVKMAHDSSIVFDGNTMWVAYYCDETTYEESLSNTTTYIGIKKCNPYTREVIASTTFKVGDSIGQYTQATKAPYIPKLVVYESYILVYFLGYDTTASEVMIASFRVDKDTLELSDFAPCTLEDQNGLAHTLNCTGLADVYYSYTGTQISTSIIGFTAQPQKYNGYWYNTVNTVFSGSMNTLFIKSSDGIAWTVERVMTETGVAEEASFVIKDGYVYVATRSGSKLVRYSIDPSVSTCKQISIPLTVPLKTAMCIYRDEIILATNIRCVYNSNVSNNRKNFGFFTVDENLNVNLKTRIITEQGMHYPAMAVENDELWFAWSNDYRFLSRMSMRTNIAVSKIVI